MLTVSYQDRIGYYSDGETRIDICRANCLCAMIHFADDRAELWSFFADLQHAEACISDSHLMDGCNDFVFDMTQCDDDIWSLIRLIAENGKRVTIQ